MRTTVVALLAVSCLLLTACTNAKSAAGPQPIRVVAAENFWGSIAKQLGGDKIDEVSIITNPDTDPHDYDATAADSRTMAQAQLAIVNGVGYDEWASKLLSANPDSTRKVVNAGDVTRHKHGDNPHRWYSPGDVRSVVEAITNSLEQIDPGDWPYFETQKQTFELQDMAIYNGLISDIRTKYAGVPVGATESIFSPMAQALDLNLLTPPGYLSAISEGDDPTAADKSAADAQVENRQIRALIFNSQNATPDVQMLVNEAHSQGIPVVSVTETLTPANASFQSWQTSQLQALDAALAVPDAR